LNRKILKAKKRKHLFQRIGKPGEPGGSSEKKITNKKFCGCFTDRGGFSKKPPWLLKRGISLLINQVNVVIIKMMKHKRTIIRELKSALVTHFGEDIKDVILFGSRVTGKAHKDSDYDVLIILNNDYDWVHKEKIISIVYDLELKYDIFIDIKIISTNELFQTIKGKHPLYQDAIQKGIYA
jgi:predicted nucleotidyltransferase